jgi:hypothetical protein
MATGEQPRRGGGNDSDQPREPQPGERQPSERPATRRSAPRDLSKNVAGVGVTHEATRRRQREGAEAARSWDVGAKGERQVGDVLDRMTRISWWDRVRGRRPRWRVLHSVQIADAAGRSLGDIDHVLIGPPGVITINSKYHRRGNVLVDDVTVIVNGRRTSYLTKSRREADRARSMLTAALSAHHHPELAANLPVRPLIVVVGAVPRVEREPDVPVVALQRLRHTAETMHPRLDADQVAAVHEVALSEDTWILAATRG